MRGGERFQAVTDEDLAELQDDDLPVYTVLAPMFHEAASSRTWSPTCHSWMQIIRVPRGHPQTKPKACNVGLFFARGDHLVIYDAEDKPDPDQLKKAVVAFRRGGEQMVCVQAALNYWNVNENFLTRMFTAEYSFWFDYMLPGPDALHLPIPLGGTSNHFRTEDLRKLGGWNPFNVTEDADLGMRASALGYTVGVINSTTFEEANRNFRNWIRQRSRWAGLADTPMSGTMRRMIDRATVSRWLAGYETAWRTPGSEDLTDLFTSDAVYLQSPYERPVTGLDAIKRMWEEEREGPDEVFTLTTEIVAVDGLTAVVRAEVRYGDPPVQDYRDLWIIRFADDGRCTWFEEWPYWPGRPYAARDDVG